MIQNNKNGVTILSKVWSYSWHAVHLSQTCQIVDMVFGSYTSNIEKHLIKNCLLCNMALNFISGLWHMYIVNVSNILF